jgi:deazaflavin-dependent oxidoreductase (nitroreductase family)
MTWGLRLGIPTRSTALLETTGRRSGEKRVTPVTDGLDGDRFWIVTEHGMAANYVRNLLHDPHVRVKARGRWRAGVAQLVDEDPAARLASIVARNPRARTNARIVRRSATDLRVIRIDLEGL